MSLDGANIVVTGGTGSFGKRFVRRVLERYKVDRLVVLSRDEVKQVVMRQQYPVADYPCVRMFIGDVRDRERLYRALDGVDIVVHAAALKQVPIAEYNPLEAIKTNVLGAANVIDAAIDRGVKKVIALSTDKAANPVNLYGATKLCADKLFVAANAYSGFHRTCFGVVRYGNVVGSRGSVIPYFLAQRPTGRLTITDPRMTRFLITLDQGVDFVLKCLEITIGGEIFVPKIPSVRIADLAQVIAPNCKQEIIGFRPGEKLHEVLVTEDDARLTIDFEDHYLVQPSPSYWNGRDYFNGRSGKMCPEGFKYSSDTNSWWLSREEIARLVQNLEMDRDFELMSMPAENSFGIGH